MTVTLVAAVAENGVIGREGALPWRLPEDLAHFKSLTLGHVLVMGRRTYDSIGRVLPGRTTIVVTRQPAWTAAGVVVASSLQDAITTGSRLADQVFVVGGAEVYAEAVPVADRMVISHVDQAPSGDRTFPEVDWTAWRAVTRERRAGFDIVTYERPPAT